MRILRKSSSDVDPSDVGGGFLVDRSFNGYQIALLFREPDGGQLQIALDPREAYDAALHILECLGVARGRLEEIDRLMRKAHRP